MNFKGFLGNRIEYYALLRTITRNPLLRSSFRAFYTWLATASTYSVHLPEQNGDLECSSSTKLIKLYKERPNLYNIKDKSYHNRDLRSKAYSEIATALDISGIIIQYIINSNYVLNF